jgi:hypothetical protein
MRALAAALLLILVGAGAAQAAAPWKVTKTEWTEADERGFSEFVRAIGRSNCTKSNDCIRVAGNIYRKTDPKGMKFIADCADFPYMLRAYYAWKHGLPFGYVDGVSGRGGDMRWAKNANRPVSRRTISSGSYGPGILSDVHGGVSSATYRTDVTQEGGVLSDFYSPKIQPGSIRPGTVIYDVNGHVAIIYDIDEEGRIYYMDAHPDHTVTRSTYGPQFGQSPARLGGGIKNWRPVKYVKGTIVAAENKDIPDFSLEQYTGNVPGTMGDGEDARFAYNGVELGFYEYVRVAVSGGKSAYNPVYELRSTMRTLCNDLKDRALFVNMAIKDRINQKPQPDRLPDNIYGTDSMEWETYSTPSRDARIKTAFASFYASLQKMLFFWKARDPRIVYDGIDLKGDLERMYDDEAEACRVTYVNSAGKNVTMNFTDMMKRLFAMSFDPYHCIERRWGATSAAELASCKDDRAKQRWYEAERRLRNQIDRTYEARMDFSVAQLEQGVLDSGQNEPPSTDIRVMIDTIGNRNAFVGMQPVGH